MRSLFLAGLTLMFSIGHSTAADLESFGRPALLSFSSDYATIETSATGVTTITFHDVSKLTTITSDLHRHHQRAFAAFPTRELAAAWNTCNAMKFENKLFHNDGVNAIMTFSGGPSDAIESGHLSTAPLITQTKPIEQTKGGSEGALALMLVDAVYADASLTFKLLANDSPTPKNGKFIDTAISTECFAPGL